MSSGETVHTLYGRLVVTSDEDLISRSLRLYGEWARIETKVLARFINDDDEIWDIGAYLGTFGLGVMLDRRVTVTFVEPNTSIVGSLRSNVASARQDGSCRVINAAVGNSDGGWARSTAVASANVGSAAVEPCAASDAGAVPVYSLTALAEHQGPPKLIKLDIEGGEAAALDGAGDWIVENRPMFWIECNEVPGVSRIFTILRDANYIIYYVTIPAFNMANFNGVREDIFGGVHEAGFLALCRALTDGELSSILRRGCQVTRLRDAADLLRAMWLTPRCWTPDLAEMGPGERLALLQRSRIGLSFESYSKALEFPG